MKWVDGRFAVEQTPRGEWVVTDYDPADGLDIPISPVGNAFFKTFEEAWEFATR